MILLDFATILVYGLLTAAILAVWLPASFNKIACLPSWIIVFTLSVVSGLYYGIVEFGGILYLISLWGVCRLVKHSGINITLRLSCGLIVIAMVAALFLHGLSFFNNPIVFDKLFLSDASSAYSKHWNFDKAAAGLILLTCFGEFCRTPDDWKILFHRSYITSTVTIILSLALALTFGYIKLDVTFASTFFVWAWANLFFTCIPEELLFRGFVQRYITVLPRKNSYKICAIVFVGILFGLAHLAGGITYALVASVAGTGYGYAYFITGRIESAILTHFLLNSVHFLFFTYPYIKGAV